MITIIGEVGRPATQEEIERFVNTKNWSDMTDQEVCKIKKEQCLDCEYFSQKSEKQFISEATCNYLLITGHRRGCSPLDCVLHGTFKRRIKTKRTRKAQ